MLVIYFMKGADRYRYPQHPRSREQAETIVRELRWARIRAWVEPE